MIARGVKPKPTKTCDTFYRAAVVFVTIARSKDKLPDEARAKFLKLKEALFLPTTTPLLADIQFRKFVYQLLGSLLTLDDVGRLVLNTDKQSVTAFMLEDLYPQIALDIASSNLMLALSAVNALKNLTLNAKMPPALKAAMTQQSTFFLKSVNPWIGTSLTDTKPKPTKIITHSDESPLTACADSTSARAYKSPQRSYRR